jgi:hypothetical protein
MRKEVTTMSRGRQPHHARRFVVRPEQPLIGVIREEDGQQVVEYFTDDAEVDAATPPQSVQRALSLLGAWRDLDWEEAVTELDRIRHASRPTPPIELPELTEHP